ncbi:MULTISPECIES: ATP-binding protein [unclassified Brevundimonas]|uniref:ATP-binding protein n=1 Tax=unclassified Brevundimonas TaxID=2622653 RepID=UPI0025C4C86B|nr:MULTISPECIES: ATP-binding protein [unclassified Brevundimonas]
MKIGSLFDLLTGQTDGAPLPPGAAGRRNMLLLIQLRWFAVVGQALTIAVVHWGYGIPLPLGWLLLAPTVLVVLNLVSLPLVRRRLAITDGEIFTALCIDAGALTWLLYFSGGASNPFSALFVMQIVLAAVLLRRRYVWIFVLGTSAIMAALALMHRPLLLPEGADERLGLLMQGAIINFMLIAVLLAAFVSRTIRNVRARDAWMAESRQQAAEHEHIVRMGLLASGAAHELGTPLASISVLLGDWRHIAAIKDDPELLADVEQMQSEVDRCKSIVTNILMAAGAARGQSPRVMRLSSFLGEVVQEWHERGSTALKVEQIGPSPHDPFIIADEALRQVLSALIDNAAEAEAGSLVLNAVADGEQIILTFLDDGPGIPQQILSRLGQPYQSTKGRAGAGLGLFLLVNTMRTLGGEVVASNRREGGASVQLRLPTEALAPK